MRNLIAILGINVKLRRQFSQRCQLEATRRLSIISWKLKNLNRISIPRTNWWLASATIYWRTKKRRRSSLWRHPPSHQKTKTIESAKKTPRCFWRKLNNLNHVKVIINRWIVAYIATLLQLMLYPEYHLGTFGIWNFNTFFVREFEIGNTIIKKMILWWGNVHDCVNSLNQSKSEWYKI